MTHVHLKVPESFNWFFVQDRELDRETLSEVDTILDDALKYENPDAEWSVYQPAYIHLYQTDSHGAARGLMTRAKRILKEHGFDVETSVEGDRTGDFVDLGWTGEYDLRGYQKNAVNAAIEEEGGVLYMQTGTGKTVTAMRLLYELHPISGRSIVLVHTQELLYQWAEEIEKSLGVEPGLIGDGNWTEGPVTVAIMQTLLSRGVDDLEYHYGAAIFDECHQTSAADTMHDIGVRLNSEFTFGLSATPWRNVEGEELKIEGAVGELAFETDAEWMIENGYLAEPEFDRIEHYDRRMISDYHDAFRKQIELSSSRNQRIAQKAAKLAEDGYSVLVNVNRIAQGALIEMALRNDKDPQDVFDRIRDPDDEPEEVQDKIDAVQETRCIGDYNAVFLSGADSTDRRQKVLEAFEAGALDILVSTIVKEGVDIPSMNAIILAHAGKSDRETIQVIGRALRPSGGDKALIVDVHDRGGIFFEDAYRERQQTMSEYYGDYGPTTVDDVDGSDRNRIDPEGVLESDEIAMIMEGSDEP